jgi:Putative Tad-like Flp pilus-assembly
MAKMTKQAGQALVAATVGLVALLAATGLAIDMGYLRYQKRLEQSAADSAALAGAAVTEFGGNIQTAAQQDASLNGFTDGVNHVTVTANSPTTGPYAGDANAVEVTVTAVQPTFFMKIIGLNSTTLSARAVAFLSGGGARGCLYTLGGGITSNGGGGINAPKCGIIDNQDLTKNGSGSITAASIGVHGTVSDHGPGAITPTPVTGIVQAADPLSYLKPPGTGGGCTNKKIGGGGKGGKGGGGPVTIGPGNYCGISVSGNTDVTLTAGTYVITGNGVSFNGTGTVSGTGVTIYFAPGGGGLTFGGNETIQLSAPTTGPYAGILIYQNPANNSGATLDGANGSSFEGAVYIPGGPLTINGAAGSTAAYTIVVAQSVTLNGATFNLPANYSSLPGGSPIKDAVLVE